MIISKLYFCFLLLLLAIMPANAQTNVSFKLYSSTSSAKIGEPVRLQLVFVSPGDYRLRTKQLTYGDSIITNRQLTIDSTLESNSKVVELKTEITRLDSGWIEIPQQTWVYEKPGFQDVFIVKSNSLKIFFGDVAVDTSKSPMPAHGAIDIIADPETHESNYLCIFGSVCILIIAIALIWLGWKGNKAKLSVENNDVGAQLKLLSKNRTDDAEQLKVLYSELSAVLNILVKESMKDSVSKVSNDQIVFHFENKLDFDKFQILTKAKRRIELVQFASKAPKKEEFIEDCKSLIIIHNIVKAND